MDSAPPKAPGIAVSSLILGILSFFTCLLTGIPAIITGHIALSRIKKAGGALGGQGLALAGTIMGYLSIVAVLPAIAFATPAVFQAIKRADLEANRFKAHQIHVALLSYSTSHNEEFPPDLESLISSGDLADPGVLDYKLRDSITHWTYYPGLGANDYSSIILAGPATKDSPPKRIVLYVDGSARIVDEPEAQTDARRQGIALP